MTHTPKNDRFISGESIGRLETIYLCPLPYSGTDNVGAVKCNFRTSKKGIKEGDAATHLSKDHKVKPMDIVIARDKQPGLFKFDKIKMPIC